MSPPEPEAALSRNEVIVGATLIAVLTLLAYLPALGAGFVWDDDAYVTRNPLLTAPDGLQRIWFSQHSQSQYFPLVYTAFRVEHALWGFDPFGYHLVNVLLHAANALLVWTLLRRLGVPGSWLAAAIFALHPVQVESVAWITELKNVLSTLLYLLSLLAWLKFADDRWRFYGLAMLLYALALFAKTTACTLPAAMLLIFWLRKQPIGWRRLAQVVPFLVLGLAMGLVSIWWERHLGIHGEEYALDFSVAERALIASRALGFYLGKLLWPAQLTFSYPRWEIDAGDPAQYGWLLACVVAGLALAWIHRKWGRGPVVAAAFFVATLSPMLGFISLFTFRYAFVADHYQYVAAIGPIALFAALVWTASARARTQRYVSTSLLLFILVALTWQQSHIYNDEETLWRDTLAKNPDSLLAHINLGPLLAEKGDHAGAIAHYREAVRLRPDVQEAHNNLGAELALQGKFDEAIAHFSEAVRISPDYPLAHFNLGRALLARGRAAEAIPEYREALRLDPGSPQISIELAWILATHDDASVRDSGEAVKLAERACRSSGDRVPPEFLYTLAAAYAAAGRFSDAVPPAEKALELAVAMGNRALAQQIETRLERYKSARPYREGAAGTRQ